MTFLDFRLGDQVLTRPEYSGGHVVKPREVGEVIKVARVNLTIRAEYMGDMKVEFRVRRENVCAVARDSQVIWREEEK